MKYFQNYNKKTVVISLIIGLFIAILMRASLFVFTTDFSYFNINHIAYPAPEEFDRTYLGKQVIGVSGFPFSVYTHCGMGFHGTLVSPACEKSSFIGEFAIALNTVFWALFVYFILEIIPKKIRKTRSKK